MKKTYRICFTQLSIVTKWGSLITFNSFTFNIISTHTICAQNGRSMKQTYYGIVAHITMKTRIMMIWYILKWGNWSWANYGLVANSNQQPRNYSNLTDDGNGGRYWKQSHFMYIVIAVVGYYIVWTPVGRRVLCRSCLSPISVLPDGLSVGNCRYGRIVTQPTLEPWGPHVGWG